MIEVFSGIVLPMAAGRLPNFKPIFERYATDLKAEAEQGGRRRSGEMTQRVADQGTKALTKPAAWRSAQKSTTDECGACRQSLHQAHRRRRTIR